MSTYYEIGVAHKFAEEDIYGDGCQPGTSTGARIDINLTGGSAAEVIEKARQYLGADKCEVRIGGGVGEEAAGRVDISMLETGDGGRASAADLAAWREGRRRLWLADYIMHVEKITAEDVDLSAAPLELDAEYSRD